MALGFTVLVLGICLALGLACDKFVSCSNKSSLQPIRGNNEMNHHFGFDKSSLDTLAKFKKGDKVTLVCTGKGDVAKIPMFDPCS